jgi:hypothetical protein
MAPEAGLDCCQPHPAGDTAVGAGQAALFPVRSVSGGVK